MPSAGSVLEPDSEPHRSELGAIAVLGVFAATALELGVAGLGLVPDSTPAQQYQDYLTHTTAFAEYAVGFVAFALLGVPFVVALGLLLRRTNPYGAMIASALWVVGILIQALSASLYTSWLAAIEAASGTTPALASPAYQAAIVNNVLAYWVPIGWIGIAIGFFLMAWVARRSGIVPNWLGVVGLAGGIGSLPIGPLPEFVGTNLFAVWGLAIAILFVQRLRLPALPIGLVFIIVGVPYSVPVVSNALPLTSWLSNTPVWIFFLASGAVLVWLGLHPSRKAEKTAG